MPTKNMKYLRKYLEIFDNNYQLKYLQIEWTVIILVNSFILPDYKERRRY